MSVCQIRIGDGRDDYHKKAVESIEEMIPAPDCIVEVDDRDHLLGFSGAVQLAWDNALLSGCDYIMHCELDFTYNEPVELDAMTSVLEQHPEIVQMSLKRQPVNDVERAAGDILALNWEDYTEVAERGEVWVQHRCFWTTNPSLYRTDLCRRGWPQEERSEGKFTGYYFRDHPDHVSGIWGAKSDPPRVTHIGDERTGKGY